MAVHEILDKLHALELQQLRILFHVAIERHADLPWPREHLSVFDGVAELIRPPGSGRLGDGNDLGNWFRRNRADLNLVRSTPISIKLFVDMARLPAEITHLHFPYPLGEIAHLLVGRAPRLHETLGVLAIEVSGPHVAATTTVGHAGAVRCEAQPAADVAVVAETQQRAFFVHEHREKLRHDTRSLRVRTLAIPPDERGGIGIGLTGFVRGQKSFVSAA